MKTGIINIIIGKPLVDWWELCCTQNPSEEVANMLYRLIPLSENKAAQEERLPNGGFVNYLYKYIGDKTVRVLHDEAHYIRVEICPIGEDEIPLRSGSSGDDGYFNVFVVDRSWLVEVHEFDTDVVSSNDILI